MILLGLWQHNHRVDEGQVGFVLEICETVIDDLLRRIGREIQLAHQLGTADERFQAEKEVRFQQRDRMLESLARNGFDRSARRRRRHQNRSRGMILLQIFLHDQSPQGMADKDGRLGKLRRSAPHVVDIMMDAIPDAAGRPVVATEPHGANVVAALSQKSNEIVPAPRAMPCAVDEKNAGHADAPMWARERGASASIQTEAAAGVW